MYTVRCGLHCGTDGHKTQHNMSHQHARPLRTSQGKHTTVHSIPSRNGIGRGKTQCSVHLYASYIHTHSHFIAIPSVHHISVLTNSSREGPTAYMVWPGRVKTNKHMEYGAVSPYCDGCHYCQASAKLVAVWLHRQHTRQAHITSHSWLTFCMEP